MAFLAILEIMLFLRFIVSDFYSIFAKDVSAGFTIGCYMLAGSTAFNAVNMAILSQRGSNTHSASSC